MNLRRFSDCEVPIGNPFPVDGDKRRYDPLSAVSAGISGVGSIVGGIMGRNAAKEAGTAQANAQQKVIDRTGDTLTQGYYDVNTGTDRANQTLQQTAQQQTGLLQPYAAAGTGALSQLQQLSGADSPLNDKFTFDSSNLKGDPGYDFTLQQGQDAINRAAAAKGHLFSTGTLKSLAGFTTGAANQYANDALTRAKTVFDTNRQGVLSRISTLQGLFGTGASAAGQQASAVGSAGQQTAANQTNSQQFLANLGQQSNDTIARALTGQGDAVAASKIGGANAISGAISGVGNAAQSGAILDFLSKRSAASTPGYGTGGGVTFNGAKIGG